MAPHRVGVLDLVRESLCQCSSPNRGILGRIRYEPDRHSRCHEPPDRQVRRLGRLFRFSSATSRLNLGRPYLNSSRITVPS
jgi:hypothetical protein